MTDRDDLISVLKQRQDLNNSFVGNDEAEMELSVESRSFVNRVNDQVRQRQKKKTFYDLEKVYGCNNGISRFMGNN